MPMTAQESPAASAGTLLVGVANPATVERLMQIAAYVARYAGYQVVATHVVTVAPQISLISARASPEVSTARELLNSAIAAGAQMGIHARGIVQVAREVHHGIISAASAHNADIILLGYSEVDPDSQTGSERAFDRLVHRVARGAKAHMVVAKFRVPEIRSILFPVGAGLNLPLTALLAKSLIAGTGATVRFLHVVSSEHEIAAARKEVAELLAAQGLSEAGQLDIAVGASPQAVILDRAADHDLAIVGTEPPTTVSEAIFGNLAERIAAQAPCSVLLARARRLAPS